MVQTDEELRAEWARASRSGQAVKRKKALATLASVAVTLPILGLGYLVFFLVWPFERVPVVLLAIPWAPALAAGWWVRGRLWPRGALGR